MTGKWMLLETDSSIAWFLPLSFLFLCVSYSLSLLQLIREGHLFDLASSEVGTEKERNLLAASGAVNIFNFNFKKQFQKTIKCSSPIFSLPLRFKSRH